MYEIPSNDAPFLCYGSGLPLAQIKVGTDSAATTQRSEASKELPLKTQLYM